MNGLSISDFRKGSGMGFGKKKKPSEEKSIDELMRDIQRYKEWRNDPNRSYKNSPYHSEMSAEERMIQDAHIRKLERRFEKKQAFFSTLRDIILTPLGPIFGILSLISKIAMYVGTATFLFACYKVYESVRIGDGLGRSIMAEYRFLILPFIASFLYFIFSRISVYCSDHSLY